MTDDIFVYMIDLPGKIKEVVTPCADGYTIYIDQNLSKEKQLESYMHAFGHIKRNDFQCGKPVGEIENRAHGD